MGEILNLVGSISPKPRHLKNAPSTVGILRALAIVFTKIPQEFARPGPRNFWANPPKTRVF